MASRTKLFISYSHEDIRSLKDLKVQLGVLERERLLDVYEDTQLQAGERWYERLHSEMSAAKVGLLLISAPFLSSGFILNEEVPRLFDRHAAGGMSIYPLLVRPCAWQQVSWLSKLQLHPQDTKRRPKALSEYARAARDQVLADVANEIARMVTGGGSGQASSNESREAAVPLDAVLHPASGFAQQVAKDQQTAAAAEPTVRQGELTAQAWFEQGLQGSERIENPRILCAASEQYAEPSLGFHLDIAVIEKAFPNRVQIERKLTRNRLRDLLTNQHFDIVHLVLAVDPDNGDLIFSPIDFTTNRPTTSSPDRMSAEGFAALLVESSTKLVVLATCKALLLAVEVANVANMAASDAIITGLQAAEWEECFYGLLAKGKPLFKAFEITKSQSSIPIRAIRKKDVVFAPVG